MMTFLLDWPALWSKDPSLRPPYMKEHERVAARMIGSGGVSANSIVYWDYSLGANPLSQLEAAKLCREHAREWLENKTGELQVDCSEAPAVTVVLSSSSRRVCITAVNLDRSLFEACEYVLKRETPKP